MPYSNMQSFILFFRRMYQFQRQYWSRGNFRFSYIRQTTNLLQRVRRHQSGHGEIGTADPADRPFALADYIFRLGSYSTIMRMRLERQQRHYHNQFTNDDVFNIIQQEERIVTNQNLTAETHGSYECLIFVEMTLPYYIYLRQ